MAMIFLLFILLLPMSWGHRISNKSAVCSTEQLTKPQGELSSPGYPHRYPNNTICTWMIFIPESALLSIHIVDLDIEESSDEEICTTPCCTNSWLSLSVDNRGWQPETSQEVDYFSNRQICGTNNSITSITLSQRITVITFHTGKQVDSSRRGFKLLYRTSVSRCKTTEFRCNDYFCVDGHKRCNGEKDCADGSDEDKCHKLGYYCPSPKIPCGLFTPECYDNESQRCDWQLDCKNGIDEMGCGNCKSNELRCRSSRQCYKESQICDGERDCPFHDDEIDCDQTDECEGKIRCTDQIGCYNLNQRCDDYMDCIDGSDEKGCPTEYTPRWTTPCPKGPRCNNGACITTAQWCNGVVDCDDSSDEYRCSKDSYHNSVIAAAVMGSLVCGLLLVLAVGCFCRVYGMRLGEEHSPLSDDAMSQFTNSGTNPHQTANAVRGSSHLPPPLEEEFWHREPPPAYSAAVGLSPSAAMVPNVNNDSLFTTDQPSMRLPRTARPPRIRTRRSQSSQAAPPTAMNNTVIIRPRPRPRPRTMPTRTLGFVCPTTSATSMVPLEIPSAHRYQQAGKSDKCNSDNIVLESDLGIDNINPSSGHLRESNNQLNTERLVFTNQSSLSSDNLSNVSPSTTSTTSLMSGFSEPLEYDTRNND